MIAHAFVINMPKSVERYWLFCESAKVSSIEIERINGVDGLPYMKAGDKPLTRGIIGYIKAACNAINLAKKRGYENFLIFDDDAELADDFDLKLKRAMDELPEDWAMLRLHPTTTGKPQYKDFSANLKQVYGGNGSYGYVLNSKYYDVILKAMEDNFRLPSKQDIGYIKTYDVILQELMESLPFFETKETLAYHRDGYSDRMGQVVNFGLGKPKVIPSKIKIRASAHIQFHAETLSRVLNDLGLTAEIVADVEANDDSLYILYCAFQVNHPPKNYIVYQCEQWQSHWFTPHYFSLMRGALHIWEWSFDNVRKYPADIRHKVLHVPCGTITPVLSEKKDIDVLFYGAVNGSPHRQKFIAELRRYFKIVVIDNLYGKEMLEAISISKVVLNLHYYNRATLEMFRINESLCCGANIVSERVANGFYPLQYHGIIYYGSTIRELKVSIEKALNNKNAPDLSVLDNTQHIRAAISKVSFRTSPVKILEPSTH